MVNSNIFFSIKKSNNIYMKKKAVNFLANINRTKCLNYEMKLTSLFIQVTARRVNRHFGQIVEPFV